MKRETHQFRSSRVDQATYDSQRKEIIVTFTDGVRWKYGEVERPVWVDFITAESAGKFLNTVLTRKYPNRAA